MIIYNIKIRTYQLRIYNNDKRTDTRCSSGDPLLPGWNSLLFSFVATVRTVVGIVAGRTGCGGGRFFRTVVYEVFEGAFGFIIEKILKWYLIEIYRGRRNCSIFTETKINLCLFVSGERVIAAHWFIQVNKSIITVIRDKKIFNIFEHET